MDNIITKDVKKQCIRELYDEKTYESSKGTLLFAGIDRPHIEVSKEKDYVRITDYRTLYLKTDEHGQTMFPKGVMLMKAVALSFHYEFIEISNNANMYLVCDVLNRYESLSRVQCELLIKSATGKVLYEGDSDGILRVSASTDMGQELGGMLYSDGFYFPIDKNLYENLSEGWTNDIFYSVKVGVFKQEGQIHGYEDELFEYAVSEETIRGKELWNSDDYVESLFKQAKSTKRRKYETALSKIDFNTNLKTLISAPREIKEYKNLADYCERYNEKSDIVDFVDNIPRNYDVTKLNASAKMETYIGYAYAFAFMLSIWLWIFVFGFWTCVGIFAVLFVIIMVVQGILLDDKEKDKLLKELKEKVK